MIDRLNMSVKSGDGGDGVVSFRREKFAPFGGPDGGDGGGGGDVIIRADTHITDLRYFRRRRFLRAKNGGRGGGKKKHGKRGEDLIIGVPPGTIVFSNREEDRGTLIADLKEGGDEVIVAPGGRGGLGNIHFATPSYQAPEKAEKGSPGEEYAVILEMRLIADAGIVGYPNAGKSTLLTTVSAARPKIADYSFTTLEPILGLVSVGKESFVMAEIPGLIEGAHLGKGLGHDFLRHALRNRVLICLVDGTRESPVADMIALNNELTLFDTELARKPQLVAVNKIDLPRVQERLDEIRQDFKEAGKNVFFISSATGEGVSHLMAETLKILKSHEREEAPATPVKVFRPRPRGQNEDV